MATTMPLDLRLASTWLLLWLSCPLSWRDAAETMAKPAVGGGGGGGGSLRRLPDIYWNTSNPM